MSLDVFDRTGLHFKAMHFALIQFIVLFLFIELHCILCIVFEYIDLCISNTIQTRIL